MNATDFPADAPDAPDDLDAAFPFDLPPLVEGDPVDVVILGAGVNGAGLFRDLCAQGVNCLIVDRGDFGGGASAAGSPSWRSAISPARDRPPASATGS